MPSVAPPPVIPKSTVGVRPKNSSPKQRATLLTPSNPACTNYTLAAGVALSGAIKNPNGIPMAWGADYLQPTSTTQFNGDYTPRSVPGPIGATAISSLGTNTLILIKGTVWGWGQNSTGDLGVGDRNPRNVAAQATGINGIIAISSGYDHALALKSDGTVWAWGGDGFGQLGIAPPPPNNLSTTPVQVGFTFPAAVVQIAAGNGTSLALDANGTVWTWGTPLGVSPTQLQVTPTAVSFAGNPKIVLIAIGVDHALAVDSSGNLWSWGGNAFGELGNGTTTASQAPAIVLGINGVAAIAAGQSFSLVTDSAGRVWVWGKNDGGQLGIGNEVSPQTSPVQNTSLSGPVAFAAGQDHAFALFASGSVYGWGDSGNGQVGTGFSTTYLTPQLVSISGVAQPSACAGAAPTGSGPSTGPSSGETNGGPPKDEKPVSCDGGNDPVNCVTGDFWHTVTDLTIPGRGPNISFQRTYNSLLAVQNGPVGFGWTDSYNVYLTFDGAGNPTVHEENGATLPFTLSGTTYTAPSRVLATLVHNVDSTYTLTRRGQFQLKFNSGGQLVSETDRNSYSTTLTYNAGQLATVTDQANRVVTLAYWPGGQLKSLTDPANRTVQFTYDSNGNLQSVLDLNGQTTTYSYDSNHFLLTITDPRLAVLSNVFDSSGRVTQQTDQLNRVTKYSYGPTSTTVTYPDGSQSLEVYQNGGLATRIDAYGTGLATNTAFTYDSTSLSLTTFTDALGEQAQMSSDSAGNLLSLTDPNQVAQHYTYNSFDEPLTTLDSLNVKTTNTYDTFGNMTSSSTPLVGTTSNQVTNYTYDPAHPGDLVQVTDPDGQVWKYTYDIYGNRIKAIDPLGNTTTYAYDVVGRMTGSVSPLGNVTGGNPALYTTSYTFDGFGDVLTVTDPLGNVTTYTYDGNRNRTSVADALHHATTYTYDLVNQQTQVTRVDGSTLLTGYDVNGRVITQTDGLNHATSYTYNALGNIASITDPLGRITQYGYGTSGYPFSVYDPSGRVTSYVYDAGGRITGVVYSDAQTPNVSLAYDADNQRTGMTDGTGTSTYTYDSLHRVTKVVNGANATVSYAYDLKGQLIKITYPGGTSSATRVFDAAGRLTSVTDWNSNKTTFAYDGNSNLTTWTYPNTTVSTWTYDRANSVTNVKDTTGSKGTVFLNLAYTRDADHQLTAEGSQAFAYDTVNRLRSAASTTYGYDNADELAQISVTGGNTTNLVYDAASQLSTFTVMNGSTQVQKYTYTYDSQGNRIKRVDQSNNTVNMTFDQANRMTAFGSTTTYKYNGDGVRMSKTVSGTTSQVTWDTVEGLPMVLADGATSYVTGPAGLPLEQVAGKSTYYYYPDQIGSVRAIADSRGTVVDTYNYDPYGNLSSSSGTVSNPFRFAGQYLDSESGLYYMRARYYDPSTEQFTSRDPLIAQTRQAYVYAADTPLDMADPSGQESCCGGPVAIQVPVNFKQLLNWVACHANLFGDFVSGAVQSILDDLHENGWEAVRRLAGKAAKLVNGLNVATAAADATQLCSDIRDFFAALNCWAYSFAYHTVFADMLITAGVAGAVALGEAIEPAGGGLVAGLIAGIGLSFVVALIADYSSHAAHDYEKSISGG